jgi:hypothetical protein
LLELMSLFQLNVPLVNLIEINNKIIKIFFVYTQIL